MKKLIYLLPVLLLVAAGCNSLVQTNSNTNNFSLLSNPSDLKKVEYTNGIYQFSLDIKKDYQYIEHKDAPDVAGNFTAISITNPASQDNRAGITIDVFDPSKSNIKKAYSNISEYAQDNAYMSKFKPTTLAGEQAFMEESNGNDEVGEPYTTYKVMHKGAVYSITLVPSSNADFMNIVNSLKFNN